jgi:uncharacterized membrane protein
MTVLLVVSLGLNLFFASLFVGHWIAGPHGPRMAMFGQPRGPGGSPSRMIADRMAEALPPEHRASFEAVMAKHRPAVTEAAARFHESRDKVREAMAREPFDRAGLDRAFTEQRARNDALQVAIQASIAEAASTLPPEARQRLADWRAHTRRPR